MCCVRSYFRVVAANHSNCSTDNTRSNALNKRFGCTSLINLRVGNTVKCLNDSFYRISNCCFMLQLRNMYKLRSSVLEVLTCKLYDILSCLSCVVRMELNEIRVWHLADRRSCDELGMEALGKRPKSREDTLNVNNDSLTCTCKHYVLLLQEVTCHRNTTAHSNLIGSTAYTGYSDSLSAHGFCIIDHFLAVCILTDHLRKAWIMTMNNDIYILFNHNTKICFCVNWLWCSEQNVRELSSAHRTAPSIRKSVTKGLTDQSLRLAGVTHMGHMKSAGNLTVDRSWLNACCMPQILCMLRSSFKPSGIAFDLSIFFLSKFRHLVSKIVNISSLCLNAPLFCNTDQLLRILYLIIAALFCMAQCDTDLTAVIRMGSSTASYETKEVSSYDTVYVTSADTSGCLWCNTAWSHGTDTATDTLLTKFTVRSLILYTHLPCISAYLCTCLKKTGCGSFKLFHCSQFKFAHY